jgi:hypothetical protein
MSYFVLLRSSDKSRFSQIQPLLNAARLIFIVVSKGISGAWNKKQKAHKNKTQRFCGKVIAEPN